MPQPNDLSRSLTALDQRQTVIAVIEMSQSGRLVGGIVPGIAGHPLKKLPVDQELLLKLLLRWRDEAVKAGCTITRIAVAFEAGRDGFWLARWLRARDIDAHVIHPTSVAVSREHRRAKTDRLDTPLLKSNGCSLAGCVASRTTAAWPRSRRSRKKTPDGRTESARISSASARVS